MTAELVRGREVPPPGGIMEDGLPPVERAGRRALWFAHLLAAVSCDDPVALALTLGGGAVREVEPNETELWDATDEALTIHLLHHSGDTVSQM